MSGLYSPNTRPQTAQAEDVLDSAELAELDETIVGVHRRLIGLISQLAHCSVESNHNETAQLLRLIDASSKGFAILSGARKALKSIGSHASLEGRVRAALESNNSMRSGFPAAVASSAFLSAVRSELMAAKRSDRGLTQKQRSVLEMIP